MATPNLVADLPTLTRENRDLLWRKSLGIFIGLAVALLVFGGVLNIVTAATLYVGSVIEFILAWGGVLWAVLSVIDILVTLAHLHTQHIIDDAVAAERKRCEEQATKIVPE